ncbi:NAD(P)-binding domain protein [Cordyceps fumosorosea ARSEF 2679]|uniref:NAD(P)-binding domain protein n=1 Tax=Cordyceps fumosorosea (strain ARSEF 2679) TaxID=1081104 RepID=A0A168CK05_CORFA|nr:NAD(P)-binding domain protein [Cordyceps fumosorosea ARSEF 2679]OAA71471.1 NAD(P)-binding domain protein [Cordyceps fumosorosea ARSEF 2679]
MAPIRIAIIGLSGKSVVSSWASNAHLPYLLSERGKSQYQIVALLNTTVESARASIELYSLPPETRAYGDPEDLARDADVELVVCATRVDSHYKSALPSVRAGKRAYVEWPLAQDAAHARELARAAAEHGTRTLVGHQGRFAPVMVRVKEVLESGRIGKVLSSDARAFSGAGGRDVIGAGMEFFVDRAVGGTFVTIMFGHFFDSLQHVLGDLQEATGHFQLQRPDLKVVDSSNKVVDTVTANTPDLILVNGTLDATASVKQGATVSLRFRGGPPFKGDPGFVWTIHGETGELRLTAANGPTFQAGAEKEAVTLEVHDFETDQVETVDWDWSGWARDLPLMARSIGTLYDKHAQGLDDDKDGVPSFRTALHRHEQLEALLSQWKQ